jgi:4-amino-4-deoxy-L-arabinose transferase-like glycosyltransferase
VAISGALERWHGLRVDNPAQRVLAYRCSALVACALGAVSLAYLWTDPTYDEAVYLQLARTIAERGLPLRRVYEDFSQFRLFENSPPLVLYLTSISQRLFPGDDLPARLLHVAAFVLPTYATVWWFARAKFGAWAGCASLAVLLATPSYMRATSHVLLNVPLGLLACVCLLAFYQASCSSNRRWSWSLVVALTTVLAVWTKYQAVCVAAAIIPYVAYTFATRGFAGARSILLPLSAMIVGGATAVIALVWFFWAFGGGETLAATLTWNAGRLNPVSMSMFDIAWATVATARECESTLGGAVLLLGTFTLCAEARHRGLLVILASYVAATIAFNLTLFRLPGAGTSYLHSAVPALALLAGPGAARLLEGATSTTLRALLALAAIAIQIAGAPPGQYAPPRPNGSHAAATYIAAHSAPDAGVLAETVAIEFYSGRPVRALGNTFPRELVLSSLEGKSADDISFVVVDARAAPKNLDALRREWDRLLAKHFELVPAGAPGLHVYRRRPS